MALRPFSHNAISLINTSTRVYCRKRSGFMFKGGGETYADHSHGTHKHLKASGHGADLKRSVKSKSLMTEKIKRRYVRVSTASCRRYYLCCCDLNFAINFLSIRSFQYHTHLPVMSGMNPRGRQPMAYFSPQANRLKKVVCG